MQEHIDRLFAAELQFRLASAVRLATNFQRQPLDLPEIWSHGTHRVKYTEIALRQDLADFAAVFLHRSTTYLMAVAAKDAIRAVYPSPKTSEEPVRSAYQIARLIRNAFAHGPFSPRWSIDKDCRETTFVVPEVIALDTTGLHGTPLDWHQYGGPLALFRLCRFVRTEILGNSPGSRRGVPTPRRTIFQQGDLILERVDGIPPGAVLVEAARRPDGGIDLGDGYTFSAGDLYIVDG